MDCEILQSALMSFVTNVCKEELEKENNLFQASYIDLVMKSTVAVLKHTRTEQFAISWFVSEKSLHEVIEFWKQAQFDSQECWLEPNVMMNVDGHCDLEWALLTDGNELFLEEHTLSTWNLFVQIFFRSTKLSSFSEDVTAHFKYFMELLLHFALDTFHKNYSNFDSERSEDYLRPLVKEIHHVINRINSGIANIDEFVDDEFPDNLYDMMSDESREMTCFCIAVFTRTIYKSNVSFFVPFRNSNKLGNVICWRTEVEHLYFPYTVKKGDVRHHFKEEEEDIIAVLLDKPNNNPLTFRIWYIRRHTAHLNKMRLLFKKKLFSCLRSIVNNNNDYSEQFFEQAKNKSKNGKLRSSSFFH